jgi:hypothetical protein
MSTIPKDPFSIILTSVGVELLSFRKRTGKITNDEEETLTSAIVERVVRKLKEHGCYQLATDGREELEKENSRLAECLVQLNKEKNRFQSSLKEKDQQILIEFEKGVEFGCQQSEKILEELKAENERLKEIVDNNKKFFDNLWDENK